MRRECTILGIAFALGFARNVSVDQAIVAGSIVTDHGALLVTSPECTSGACDVASLALAPFASGIENAPTDSCESMFSIA